MTDETELPIRPLSRRLASVVAGFEFDPPLQPLTLDDIQSRTRTNRAEARKIAHRLACAGWLRQVKRGWYEFVPASALYPSTSAWALLSGITQPHVVSGLTAARQHSLTPQLASRHLLVLDSGKRVPRAIGRSHDFRIARLRPWRVFGAEPVVKDGVDVPMATVERVTLDAICYPDWFAGIGEAARILGIGLLRADRNELIEGAIRWRSHSLVSRLGWWGDRMFAGGWNEPERARLVAAGIARSPVALVPGIRPSGEVDRNWRVMVNASEATLQMERGVR
jgi:predicted transcriptional regulator of viral defense system